jgi:2-desacetyl-2-hydroxyethyl bacteriochlorophyllide A dehydrogenase
LYGKKDIRYEKRVVPSPKAGEALIRIKRAGICGSDVHYYQDGRLGSFTVSHPFSIGHEGAGEVVDLGEDVNNLLAGDRITIDPSRPCYKCNYCMSGRYNLCMSMRYLGSASTNPHTDGLFSEYFIMPAINCYRIPDNLSFDEAAMIEPLSVVFHAVKRAGIIYGSSVLITGGGTIGQLISMVAHAFGAGKIALSEVVKERRELAQLQGTDITLNPADSSMKEYAMEFSGGGFDIIFEASGAPSAARQAIDLVKRGGTIILVGFLPPEVSIPLNFVMAKELQVKGSFRFANVFSKAINLAASSRINLKSLITSVLPFNRIEEAIQLAGSGGNNIKVQVEI